jgi:hypothetical protein
MNSPEINCFLKLDNMRQTRKQRGGEVVIIAAHTVPDLINQMREENPGRVSVMQKGTAVGEILNFNIDVFAESLHSSKPLRMGLGKKNGAIAEFLFTINSDNVGDLQFETMGPQINEATRKRWRNESAAWEHEIAQAAAAEEARLAAKGIFKPNIINGKMKCPRCGAIEGGSSRYIAHDWNCPYKNLRPYEQAPGRGGRKWGSRRRSRRSRRTVIY